MAVVIEKSIIRAQEARVLLSMLRKHYDLEARMSSTRACAVLQLRMVARELPRNPPRKAGTCKWP